MAVAGPLLFDGHTIAEISAKKNVFTSKAYGNKTLYEEFKEIIALCGNGKKDIAAPRLKAIEDLAKKQKQEKPNEPTIFDALKDFRQWFMAFQAYDIYLAKNQAAQSKAELAQSRVELAQARAELAQARAEEAQAADAFAQAQQDAQQSRARVQKFTALYDGAKAQEASLRQSLAVRNRNILEIEARIQSKIGGSQHEHKKMKT